MSAEEGVAQKEAAAAAFMECIGPDLGTASLNRSPLYPDRRCSIVVARSAALNLDNLPVGCLDCLTAGVGRLLRNHNHSPDVAIALIDHFQLDITRVQQEAHQLMAEALQRDPPGHGIAKPQVLLSLLLHKEPVWWALPPGLLDIVHAKLRRSHEGRPLALKLAAWSSPWAMDQAEVLAALSARSAGCRSSEPERVLAGLRRLGIGCKDLNGGAQVALQYVSAILRRRPRTSFSTALQVATHFGLAGDPSTMARLEVEVLNALALLVKSDRRAAEAALQALAAEPSLSRPPTNWPAAVLALKGRSTSPSGWPAWRARSSSGSSNGQEQKVTELLQLQVPWRLVANSNAVAESTSLLLAATVIGLDAEWPPGSGDATLLQLATHHEVFVWDLKQLDRTTASQALSQIFLSPGILKLGFGFGQSDWSHLTPWLGTATRLLDLDCLWAQTHTQESRPGLRGLVSKVLGKRLDKSQQCSNWAARPLSDDQLSYAALDAYCLIQLWGVLQPQLDNIDVAASITNLVRQETAAHVQTELQLSVSDLVHCLASLDVRVGQVTSVHRMAGAGRLFCCQVDLGPLMDARQLVQGIAVAVQQRVLVFCNILPRELHGVQSQGGLLVAYYADGHCEAVQPPSGPPLGAPVASSAYLPPPADLSFEGNIWDKCRCHLSVSSDGTLLLAGMPLLISGLHCTVMAGKGAFFR